VNLQVASLITLKVPTQWTYGEGRCHRMMETETVRGTFRGSRDGMWWQMGSQVLETRYGGAGGAPTVSYEAKAEIERGHIGSRRGS
jgi:hypothetical protein